MIPSNPARSYSGLSSFFGNFTRRPFFHSSVISFFFRILLSRLCRASIRSLHQHEWLQCRAVLFQERNEIETDYKQSSLRLLETRMRWTSWFQFVLERKFCRKRKQKMSQEIGDNVKQFILLFSRSATCF